MTDKSTPLFVAAGAQDLPAVRELLLSAALPIADLVDGTPVSFWLAKSGGSMVGTVALERFGDVAMLRSLAVRPDFHGTGLGKALVRHAEARASAEGIHTLCLLTTTAAGLFDRLGYARISRAAAPEAARNSEEFRSLCPDSAVCMLKQLPRQ